ncbi:MAG: LLM class flavin-dependent oxidoreductase [Acidimicrobiales bacterium]
MRISVAFPPVPETPDHIALAEELGFHTAWVYDTPALQLDCWMTLALAAVKTDRIVLGPGVLIPSLRHPMTTASAIATLVGLVGAERVVVGVGTGFTGRRAMGQLPLKWRDMPALVGDIRRLLAGEVVDIDGKPAQMLHGAGQAPDRPIDVPFVLGVNGPRGLATAADLGCGVFTSRPRPDADYGNVEDITLLGFGTILEPGESPSSDRVMETAGPGVTVAYHAFLEQNDPRLDSLPGADRFVAAAAAGDPQTRHLRLHEGHLTELNPLDRQYLSGEAMGIAPIVCEAGDLGERLDRFAAAGVTEVAFQPMGSIDRELAAFANAAGLS